MLGQPRSTQRKVRGVRSDEAALTEGDREVVDIAFAVVVDAVLPARIVQQVASIDPAIAIDVGKKKRVRGVI